MARKTKTPAPTETILAYKGFGPDLACRGFQFEVGKTYTHNGKVEACEGGFHACESPLDVFGYYGPFDSRYALVELSGEISRGDGDSKIAAGSITIKAELKLPEFIGAAVKAIIDACKGAGDDPGGDYARIGSSGDSARIGSSGYYAQIGSSGDSARIGSSGYYARIGSSGYYARIGSSGNSARIGSSGNSARIKAEGKGAVIACAGSVEVFQAAEGGAVSIAYHDGKRTRFAVGYVGENLKAGVRYTVNSRGEFVEVSP